MSFGPLATVWQALGWACAVVVSVAYALLAHHAASVPAPGLFEACVFIVPPMGFALAVAWRATHRLAWLAAWCVLAVALWMAREQLGAGTHWLLLAQHVGVNTVLCLGFGRTLAPGAVPLISRLAKVVHGSLTPRMLRYTRGATWAWTLFFALNAGISLLLFAVMPAPVWSAFVNLLSLPLLVAMFVGEYLVRLVLLPPGERSSFMRAVTAYREASRTKGANPH